MEQVLIFATILAPVITALNQLVKKTFTIDKRRIGVVGLVIGLAIGAVAYPFTEMELVLRLWAGGLAGLSATGLFELGKQNIKKDGVK